MWDAFRCCISPPALMSPSHGGSPLPLHPPPQIPTTSSSPLLSVESLVHSIRQVDPNDEIDLLIDLIQVQLKRIKASPDQASTSSSSLLDSVAPKISLAAKIVNTISTETDTVSKTDISKEMGRLALHGLKMMGEAHWLFIGLSVAAYALERFVTTRCNVSEYSELLEKICFLAKDLKRLKEAMPGESERLAYAVVMIVEGAVMCCDYISKGSLSRYGNITAAMTSKTTMIIRDISFVSELERHKNFDPEEFPLLSPTYPTNFQHHYFSKQFRPQICRLFYRTMDSDFQGLALDCLAKVSSYRPQDFRYNWSECKNFVAKITSYSANIWRNLSPTKEDRFTKSRCCTTSKLGTGGKKIMERAWKEVYRVVKEAELYLKRCSRDNWWIESISLSATGEAYAIHLQDLAWSVLCLHLNLIYSQGQSDESYTAAACTEMGDFHAEMCNLIRIHNEYYYEDKRRLSTIFQGLLKVCEETSMSDEVKYKVGFARFMSAKLQATIRNEPAVMGSRMSPWLQIDPKDLVPKLRVIGQGSFGKVYEGSWLGLKVAVKQISVLGEDIDDSLKDEIAVHVKLHSPFIVQLIGVCFTEGCCYLVMEFVSSSLDKLLKDRLEGERPPLPPNVAVDMMLQISRAMEHIHSQGIMHMDLKASNVLIEPSEVPEFREDGYGRVKLCDFGEARLKLHSFRSPDFAKGTCQWRAPEAFRLPQQGFESELGILKQYTHKADVYSFAMTCYEILTGKQPFEGVDTTEVYGLIIQDKRPCLPPWCPSELADYIRKCWNTDPDCRPSFTHVSYFLRYMKFLLMRVNNSRHSDSLTAICKKFDVATLIMCAEKEQGSDERAVNFK